jgi:hypothetical protein
MSYYYLYVFAIPVIWWVGLKILYPTPLKPQIILQQDNTPDINSESTNMPDITNRQNLTQQQKDELEAMKVNYLSQLPQRSGTEQRQGDRRKQDRRQPQIS